MYSREDRNAVRQGMTQSFDPRMELQNGGMYRGSGGAPRSRAMHANPRGACISSHGKRGPTYDCNGNVMPHYKGPAAQTRGIPGQSQGHFTSPYIPGTPFNRACRVSSDLGHQLVQHRC